MSDSGPWLQTELHFRRGESSKVWERLIEATFAWDPRFRPSHVERLSDLGGEELVDWTPGVRSALAQRLANGPRVTWVLSGNQSLHSLQIRGYEDEVGIGLTQPKPEGSLVDHLHRILGAFEGGLTPAFATMYNPDTAEPGSGTNTLSRVRRVDPIMYFDNRAADGAGGLTRLRKAPCRVIESANGLILVTREGSVDEPTESDNVSRDKVAAFLGAGTLVIP